jgi:hypothetical protein
MKPASRDLLVLSKKATINKREMEREIEKLNQLLFHAEAIDKLCLVNEIIDINFYRIIRKPKKIEKLLNLDKLRAFQFIHNKN